MSIQDDKSQYVIPFIQEHLRAHRMAHPGTPFFIGLNGVQGAGKSVLVDILRATLQSPPYNLATIVFSLDDLYLSHADQETLARANSDNSLWQHRGQPGTHDIGLALETFRGLKQGQLTRIPRYNKAAFNGAGDREDERTWHVVNTDPDAPVQVVLFEGWCVGFRPLPNEELHNRHATAVRELQHSPSTYRGRLGHNALSSVTAVNDALRRYDELTDQLDAFLHIDAADPLFVYDWRLQQEQELRARKGTGMTDEQVKRFVDGYYPAYELYTETLRTGVFRHDRVGSDQNAFKGQLRLVVGQDRKVAQVSHI